MQKTSLDLEVGRCLASGPNSTVFRAYDPSTGREFALKQIRLVDNRDPASQEIAVARKLRTADRHVVSYEAAYINDDALYLVMELCAGGDLYSFMENQPDHRLTENEALCLWRQVVLGAQTLHEHGIAHRDLSLENVLLDKDHRVAKICDFGLSTFLRKGELSCGRVGKGYYMAPEVAAHDLYDATVADVWSLGVMLFILLTGSPLVQTATPSDPVFQALQRVGVLGILRHWRMDALISSNTIDLLERLLQADPYQRIQTTQAILERL